MDTIIETQQNSLRVVVQIGLLLGLNLNDGVEEVLVGDEAALPPEGDHARLYTYSLALGAVKVIRTPKQKIQRSLSKYRSLDPIGQFSTELWLALAYLASSS